MSAVLKAREAGAGYRDNPEPMIVRQFELLSVATESATRLRDLILTLAVRGRLVRQDPAEEPALRLLESARSEKLRLFSEGTAARPRTTEPVSLPEQPFRLPVGWAWARLPEVCYDFGQQTPASEFTYLDVGAIDNQKARVKDSVQVLRAKDAPSRARKLVQRGTVLYSTVRPYLKNIAIVDKDYIPKAVASTAFAVMHPHSDMQGKYLLYYLRSELFTQFVASKMVGVAYPAINDTNFFQGVIAVPPAAEQIRIVRRVDELMGLCDALEANGRLEAEQHARLLDALLGSLTSSTSPEELSTNWQRVATHFALLLDRPESVDALEGVILELATRGILVAKGNSEISGDVLLKQLRAEQLPASFPSKGSAREGIAVEEKFNPPFPLKSGWAWARAKDLCCPGSVITYGILKPVWVAVGVPTVRVQDLQRGHVVTSSIGQCSPERANRFLKTQLREGDLLIAKDGATLGKTAFVPPELAGGNITQHVLRFPVSELVNREFVRLVVDSPFGQAWMTGETLGVALPGVNVGDFRRMPIPLPPRKEQDHIVARVEQLRRVCVALREKLVAARELRTRLAEALVQKAVQPEA